MTAAGFTAFTGRFKRRARRKSGRLQIEGVSKILISGDVGMHTHRCDAGFNPVEFGEALRKTFFVPYDTRMLGHGVTDGTLQYADVLVSISLESHRFSYSHRVGVLCRGTRRLSPAGRDRSTKPRHGVGAE
ncbi:hypothetical protein QFZ23_002389 [Arthrobacter globiformis]|nr:hypothetical protein [Arthrobacter globiformis]